MNKFQKIILLCCLFSYAFSLKVTNIEPSTMTFGESNVFTLTVEDYDSNENYNFYLANDDKKEYFYMYCQSSSESSTTLKCYVYFDINNKTEALTNLTKTLFLDGEKTNLTVTFKIPESLELLGISGGQYYSYGVSRLEFRVNFNELYKSGFSIKFGDFSITNCSVSNYSISYITCYYEFPENSSEKTLNLKFGDKDTDYSVNIKAPKEFSLIDYLNKKEYYTSLSEQDVIFEVDSSYKMNDHSIKLVPESTNENITLSNCQYYDYGIYSAKCSGILNKIDAYYVFVDDKNTSLKLFVYPVPTAITSVDDIEPNELEISSSATTFTLKVNYVVNLDKAVFTLVDEFDDTNKVYLTKCKKVDNSDDEITCEGTIKNAGLYSVYLNGINQKEYVRALSSSLSKALYVDPKVIKFEPDTKSDITIYFDSVKDFSSKNIALKGTNEAKLTLNYKSSSNYVEYKATFTAADTYYVYIDDAKQEVSVLVTNEAFTSTVTAISPTLVPSEKTITFTLTVDTNLGVETVKLYLQNKDDEDYYDRLECEADSSDKTKAICQGYTEKEGEYYVRFNNGNEFKDVTVTAKNIPSLNSFSPISISPSSKEQTITLTFSDNISSFVNKVKFIIGTETVETKCTAESNYVLQCSAVFNNEDDYFITIDGVNTGKSINVNEDDNINEEEEKKKDNSVNYLKISSLLLTLLLLF